MKVPMMRAVRSDGSAVRLEEVRRVRPGTGQVLVRVTAVALDRADGEHLKGHRPVRLDPLGRRTLGRHATGTVAGVGAGVDGWPLGLPVVLQPEVSTRRATFLPGVADDGALADYIVAPAEALVPLPAGLSPSAAARLPLAARACDLLTYVGLRPGESVGVWGAGALGSVVVAVARALGAAPVLAVEPDEQARAHAHRLGADATLDPDAGVLQAVHRLTTRQGLDVAVHAAPDPAAAEVAVASLGPRGRGVLVGPAQRVGGVDRWDGRTLCGVPPLDPGALPRVVHLAHQGRLRLAEGPLAGDLATATELLDTAVAAGALVPPVVLAL